MNRARAVEPGYPGEQAFMVAGGGGCDVKEKLMTRKRLVELHQISLKIATEMDELGVKKNEHCHFGQIITSMLQFNN